MEEISAGAVRLEFASGRPPLTDLAAINELLHAIGFGLWPLDLGSAPDEIKRLLARPTLTDADVDAVLQHFLLPRQRLLELIGEAGRTPQVAGGGEMSTFDATNGVTYPQLFVIGAGVDYTRFDRFHVTRRTTVQGSTKSCRCSAAEASGSSSNCRRRESSRCRSTVSPASAVGS